MTAEMTTASDMIAALDALDPDTPLGIATDAGEIRGGYHVTELKLAEIRSIDCGGRESAWVEASLQLLDGSGGDWLSAGKVTSILKRCVAALPDLADAPLTVEFGHGNTGLSRYRPEPLELPAGRAVVPLRADGAVCKPAADFGACAPTPEARCCTPAARGPARAGCC